MLFDKNIHIVSVLCYKNIFFFFCFVMCINIKFSLICIETHNSTETVTELTTNIRKLMIN